jgi:hypothetical protein
VGAPGHRFVCTCRALQVAARGGTRGQLGQGPGPRDSSGDVTASLRHRGDERCPTDREEVEPFGMLALTLGGVVPGARAAHSLIHHTLGDIDEFGVFGLTDRP